MSLKEFHQFKCEGKGRSNNQDIRTILNIRVVILGFEALLFPGLTSRNAIKLICLLSDAQDTTKGINDHTILHSAYIKEYIRRMERTPCTKAK